MGVMGKRIFITLILIFFIVILCIYFLFKFPANMKDNLIKTNNSQNHSIVKLPLQGISSINTNNYVNRNLEYYYYVPPISDNKFNSLLIIVPSLSGRAENFVTQEFKKFAEENRFAIVSPSFIWDEKNWESQESYQYPSAWSGNALIKIINKFKQDNNLTISHYSFFGFSAGAQFSLRFCILKPELCNACAAHGGGGTVEPIEDINTKFFVTVGNQDISRIQKSKDFYNNAVNLGINATYREYPSGHSLTSAQIKDSLDFFKSIN